MRCVVCEEGTLCAGRFVCGSPPDCNDPSCQDEGGDTLPPPLDAQFACDAIYATPASYQITLYGTARFLSQTPPRILAGVTFGVWHFGQPLIAQFDGLLERVELYHNRHDAAYYAQNQYNEIGDAGRPLTFQDGLIEGNLAVPLDNERQHFQD